MSAVTPGEARYCAEMIDEGEAHAYLSNAMRSLADQVEALTADLSAEKLFSKQAMDSVTEIAAQRDALTAELELARMKSYWASISDIAIERDAFKQDAELYRHLRDNFAKNSENAREEFARLEPLTGAEFDAVVRASIAAMGAAS